MRHAVHVLILVAVATFAASCGGGSGESGGFFQLIHFVDSGKNNIFRNRILTFQFSAPVSATQDLFERLKIENVETTPGQSNFSRAIGNYVVLGEKVIFVPRLPHKPDRSDAGFRANGKYHVFLKGGPDALTSAGGDKLPVTQEFLFSTNTLFEDPIPLQPPRALGLVALDASTSPPTSIDISRLDPRRTDLALKDSNEILANSRFIEPGAGPGFDLPWEFRLQVSEPLDPASITTQTITMFEIRSDATQSADTAPPAAAPGHFGTVATYLGGPIRVPISVRVSQAPNAQGVVEVFIIVTPLGALVDDTRYRIVFSGNILGLDYTKTFIGENGLTGDGQTTVTGGTPFPEPGGLGYVSEFIVRDRPAVFLKRTLTYNPIVDGINPESGQTTADENRFNTALYNPPTAEGSAIGFIGAFGSGKNGDLLVTSGTTILDTGDTLNELSGIRITTNDLDPLDEYKNTAGLSNPGNRNFDSVIPTEFDYKTIKISAGATLQIVGRNPCKLLSAGLCQVNGTISARGGNGANGVLPPYAATGGLGQDAPAGVRGPGGFPGGFCRRGQQRVTTTSYGGCNSFETYVAAAGGRPAAFPNSFKGEGPGRGHSGGEGFLVNQQDSASIGRPSGTGGGGGSHGTAGTYGEDRDEGQTGGNVGSPIGSFGKCSQWGIATSGVIGIRGAPGAIYGDRLALDFVGGSGGGAGGAFSGWAHTQNSTGSGGGGGGGGGFLEILSAGPLICTGTIDVSGGNGGAGAFYQWQGQAWTNTTGGGGGGSGGTASLISGENIDLSGGMVLALGGTGGPRAPVPSTFTGTCNSCNAGGDGGRGYIFLMDGDGIITGITPGPAVPGQPGNYNSYATGVLSIRQFDANRFGGVNAITELYAVRVANPLYLPMATGDVFATVAPSQSIELQMSSARPDPVNPLVPLVSSEINPFPLGVVNAGGSGSVATIFNRGLGVEGDITANLNSSGAPLRDAFVRVIAIFKYTDPKQAALGPYMSMEEVTLNFRFN